MLWWLITRVRTKVGECKNPLIRSLHALHLLRPEDARQTEVADQPVSPGISSQQALFTQLAYTGEKKTGFSKTDAAPKTRSHQRPASALPFKDVLSRDELLPPPVRAGRAAGGWRRAGRDNYLYILRSGEFYFLLSSPSNRYRSCQNIKSPDDKNTLQRRS